MKRPDAPDMLQSDATKPLRGFAGLPFVVSFDRANTDRTPDAVREWFSDNCCGNAKIMFNAVRRESVAVASAAFELEDDAVLFRLTWL